MMNGGCEDVKVELLKLVENNHLENQCEKKKKQQQIRLHASELRDVGQQKEVESFE